MPRMTQAATVGAKGIDTITALNAGSASALRAAGVEFAMRYVPSLTSAEVDAIVGAGLALGCVCYADRFDGPATVTALANAGIPPGCTVFADLESDHADPGDLAGLLNAWAATLRNAGYDPGLYVGADQPLDASHLYALSVDRYWKSASRVPEPACSWCMYQLYPGNVVVAGVTVDIDVVQQDYRGRVPTFVAANAARPAPLGG